jgi:hypothetical protein
VVQAAPLAEPVIISYDMTVWNATYPGVVSSSRYEQWSFVLTETTNFVATAAATSGDLVPVVCLLDVNKNEISCLAGSVTSTQAAGKYYLLVKPQSGSGGYNLNLRVAETAAVVSFVPSSITVGETALVSVGLKTLPTGGLSSAEFTCMYDPAFLEVSGFADKGLFKTDAAMIMNGPANGSFILAIAGSNGNKATTEGDGFTFNAKALKTGSTTVVCDIRVSKGDNTLTPLASASATLNVSSVEGNILGKVNASKLVKVCAYDAGNVETCMDADEEGIFNMPLKAGVYKVVASAEGFLKAQAATVTVTAGQETLMPQITLRAGDIDGDGDVDQFDAMTIGMSYNTPVPTAADLNNDANINVLDLELLAANYRMTGPVAWE